MSRIWSFIKQKFTNFPINFWTVGGLSLVLIGLSYALYLPSLGFYLDDWPQLYSLVVRGTEGIKNYFLQDDRPFGWWPDLLIFKIWGTNPLGWHITNYLLRWLVGLGIWGTFTQIWSSHKREVFWAVQLFGVFPLFNQQSMGLTFIAHWFCYALFFLSLYLMVLAVQKPKYRLLFIALALASNIANLFTYENFIGVEFLRPVILWLALREKPRWQRIKQSLLYWLPFLALATFYVIWRVFLMVNYRGLDPVLIKSLLSEPGSTILQLCTTVFKDVLYMLVGVWYPKFGTSSLDLKMPYFISAISFSVFLIAVSIFIYRKHKPKKGSTEDSNYSFSLELIIIGILGVVMGLAPGWLVNRSLTAGGLWNDRFGLPGMWAAPLFILGILMLLLPKRTFNREVIIIILLGLAVGRNIAVTNEYKRSTTTQQRFAAQLQWRAPELRDDTALLADNELFTKMGVYPTAFFINVLYPKQQEELIRANYWFLTLNKYFSDNVEDLEDGIGIYQSHWYIKFAGWSTNSLVINWNSSGTDCLWVLTTNDRYNPLISDFTRKALGASNLESIITDNQTPWPDENLFGKEDRNTWCYYYETADLARQLGDWEKVVALHVDAKNAGFEASNGIELIPFIEAYARTGRASAAMDLTVLAKALTPNLRDYTCDTWNRVAKDVQNDLQFDAEYKAYSEQDLCWEMK